MKKYLVSKLVEAEPMLKSEAEAKLGYEINNPTDSDEGYLMCDSNTLKWHWIPRSLFDVQKCDTPIERIMLLHEKMDICQKFFKGYNKVKRDCSPEERQQVYLINRHIKPLQAAITKILNFNFINSISL